MARLLPILAIAAAIYVLYQIWIVEKNNKSKEEKLLWTLLALLFSVITAGIYYFLEKDKFNNNEKNLN
ncbi:MAG TPA: PLDc N-terminal domain-containing protein [Bacteroidales bacterium]|jgi:4-hydroxybenzoate polyprenyltransferase|nr:PLDc N-terminal domain-containing protein [Bacteroidales bacterium]HRS18565.1 PLDc N-terminal domain-containing protein [Bacteroidales bacterium]